jgi:hypothetical protein
MYASITLSGFATPIGMVLATRRPRAPTAADRHDADRVAQQLAVAEERVSQRDDADLVERRVGGGGVAHLALRFWIALT